METDETEWFRLSDTSLENLKGFLTDDEVVSEEFALSNELAFPNEMELLIDISGLHEDALEYIAGFVVRKLGLAQYGANEPTFTWVDEVSRGALVKPSSVFLGIIKSLEVVFKNFNGGLIRTCSPYISRLIECSEHVDVSVEVKKLFFKTRMYHRIKNLNKSRKSKGHFSH